MKSKVRLFCTGILLSFGFMNVAVAEQQIPADKTVYEINTYTTQAVLRFSPSTVSTEGCGGGSIADSAVMIDWTNDVNKKLLYVAVLAAQVSGKLIGFGVSGCHPWGGGIPIVYRVDVQ